MRDRQTVAGLRRMYAESLKDHELRPLVEGPHVFVYQLRRPGTRMYLVELVFTPEGILLHGDFEPPGNGTCGARLKDLPWFAAGMNEHYLAGKFLTKRWTAEAAHDHVRDNIERLRETVTYAFEAEGKGHPLRDDVLARCHRLEQMADAFEGFEDPVAYRETWEDEWSEDDRDTDWVYPDNAHDIAGVAALAEIHACFRRLFWDRYEAIERTPEGFTLRPRVYAAEPAA